MCNNMGVPNLRLLKYFGINNTCFYAVRLKPRLTGKVCFYFKQVTIWVIM